MELVISKILPMINITIERWLNTSKMAPIKRERKAIDKNLPLMICSRFFDLVVDNANLKPVKKIVISNKN